MTTNRPILLGRTSGKSALEVAVAAAQMAAQEIRTGFTKAKRLSYKGQRDIVTETDIAAEKAIKDLIGREFPGHGFLAEESGRSGEGADYLWIIDPLDGTTNYSQSIPIFCTSIALAHQGTVLLGVTNDPLREELFLAVDGQGATLNGQPITVSAKLDLGAVVAGFDLGYDEAGRKRALAQAVSLLPVARTLRLVGSAALALAYVAAGRFDVFFHHWLQPWDLAAGALLIKEAGGLATDWANQPVALETRAVLASNRALHPQMMAMLGSGSGAW